MKYKKDYYYISKVLNGDKSSYADLVNKHKEMVFTLAYRIVKNTEDAEEIAQDAFLKAYQSLHTFRFESKFSTWLYRIVYHTSISRLRKQKLKTSEINAEIVTEEDISNANESLKKLTNEDQKKYICEAINQLNEEEKTVLQLYYLNENNLKEICIITGLSSSNVKIKLHRGRKRLLTALKNLLHHEIVDLL